MPAAPPVPPPYPPHHYPFSASAGETSSRPMAAWPFTSPAARLAFLAASVNGPSRSAGGSASSSVPLFSASMPPAGAGHPHPSTNSGPSPAALLASVPPRLATHPAVVKGDV
jgi:hypothetical protein